MYNVKHLGDLIKYFEYVRKVPDPSIFLFG